MSIDYIRDTYGVPTEPVQPVPYESMTQGTFHPLGRPDLHVCPRHDFDFVADPKTGCPKCNAAPKPTEQSATQAGAGERYREQCAKGGRCLQGCLKAEQCFYAAPTEPAQPAVRSIADMPELQAAVTRGFADGSLQIEGEQPATQAGAGLDKLDALFAEVTPLPWFKHAGAPAIGLSGDRWTRNGSFQSVLSESVKAHGGDAYDNARFLVALANAWPAIRAQIATPTTEQPGDAEDAARYRGWRENAMSDAMAFADAFMLPDHREPTTSDWDAAIDAAIDAARAAHGKGGQG
jgi:hypothetical protein